MLTIVVWGRGGGCWHIHACHQITAYSWGISMNGLMRLGLGSLDLYSCRSYLRGLCSPIEPKLLRMVGLPCFELLHKVLFGFRIQITVQNHLLISFVGVLLIFQIKCGEEGIRRSVNGRENPRDVSLSNRSWILLVPRHCGTQAVWSSGNWHWEKYPTLI